VDRAGIVGVLGALDDKMELNHRMNETLEAMARGLFRSWFVDFDPVRTKAEGRAPARMDAATAALFPDGLKGSELGEIPRGWEHAPVLDFADLISGGTPKTSVADYWGGRIKWASAKDVSQCGRFFLLATERTITDAGVENSAAKVLPADCVVVVARGATCGRFTVLAEPMAMNQTCYALHAKASSARWYLRFLAEGLLQRLVVQAHGSVFDTITTSTFDTARLVVPPPSVLAMFEHAVDPFVERIRLSQRESATLAALRDTLLPKLLSGELRVRDAEKAVEQVA
jgi:type I restriction enzyme S subunit